MPGPGGGSNSGGGGNIAPSPSIDSEFDLNSIIDSFDELWISWYDNSTAFINTMTKPVSEVINETFVDNDFLEDIISNFASIFGDPSLLSLMSGAFITLVVCFLLFQVFKASVKL